MEQKKEMETETGAEVPVSEPTEKAYPEERAYEERPRPSIIADLLSSRRGATPTDVATVLLVMDYLDRRYARDDRSLSAERLAKAVAQAFSEAMKPVLESLKTSEGRSSKQDEVPGWAKELQSQVQALASKLAKDEEEQRLRKTIREEVQSMLSPIEERLEKAEAKSFTKDELETLVNRVSERLRTAKGTSLGDILTEEITDMLKDRIKSSIKDALSSEPVQLTPSEKWTKKDIINVVRSILNALSRFIPPAQPPRVMPPAPQQPPEPTEGAVQAASTTTQPAEPPKTTEQLAGQPSGATGGAEGGSVEAPKRTT